MRCDSGEGEFPILHIPTEFLLTYFLLLSGNYTENVRYDIDMVRREVVAVAKSPIQKSLSILNVIVTTATGKKLILGMVRSVANGIAHVHCRGHAGGIPMSDVNRQSDSVAQNTRKEIDGETIRAIGRGIDAAVQETDAVSRTIDGAATAVHRAIAEVALDCSGLPEMTEILGSWWIIENYNYS